MTRQQFWQGMGIGLMAGAVVGMTLQPRKRNAKMKDKAGKALRAVGDAVENISDSMGL